MKIYAVMSRRGGYGDVSCDVVRAFSSFDAAVSWIEHQAIDVYECVEGYDKGKRVAYTPGDEEKFTICNYEYIYPERHEYKWDGTWWRYDCLENYFTPSYTIIELELDEE